LCTVPAAKASQGGKFQSETEHSDINLVYTRRLQSPSRFYGASPIFGWPCTATTWQWRVDMAGKINAGLLVAAVLAAGALTRPATAADNTQTQATTTQVLALKDQTPVSQQSVVAVNDMAAPRVRSSAPHR
jgi:hypothetical protein